MPYLTELPIDAIAQIAKLPKEQKDIIYRDWYGHETGIKICHPHQDLPSGYWDTWVMLAGRGSGKSFGAAKWISYIVENNPDAHIALVGATAADARDVMVYANLLPATEHLNPEYISSRRIITWENGATAHTYSAEEASRLRGPEHSHAWCDELAVWSGGGEEAWDMLQFGLRRGKHPQTIVTTTPTSAPLIRQILAHPSTVSTTATTYDNMIYLPDTFINSIKSKYEGTRLGRQEIYAELLDDSENALWKREYIDYVEDIPDLDIIIVSVDPNVSDNGDECGIVVIGKHNDMIYVLSDKSIPRGPSTWAPHAVAAYKEFGATQMIIEANQGGDLLSQTIRQISTNVNIQLVHARESKELRAIPVVTSYEKGIVKHAKRFPKLEDQMTQWEPSVTTYSPDRLDALVTGINYIINKRRLYN